ncbi:hypothetical protein ACFZC5_25305 [Nocardia gamkensis]|uniref:hypothetical protein n=1 Tax=Nocardia gamkensis TaxID=352869 RepID=UPI0036E66346
MTDRNSADKGTDDVRGAGGVPAETGQSSKGAAVRGGASGADRDAEPGAAQRPANTSGESRGDVAEVRKAESDTRSAAAGAGGETESVSSAQVSEGASAQAGGSAGAGGKTESVSSAKISEDVPATAGAAGKPETVASAQGPEGAGTRGNADPEAARHSAAEGSPKETPIYESVRRAAERAEQVQADAATAAERGAAGIPGPVSRPGRTLLEMLRDKPILAAIPASTLAFILWRAFHRR